MTGFAAVTREDERATMAVTIRSLNHRYLDLQLRVPAVAGGARRRRCAALVGKRVSRGRVELSLSLQVRQVPGVDVEFNEEFGRALEAAIDQARAQGLVAGALTPGDLLRLPQALTIRERPIDSRRGGAGASWPRARARRSTRRSSSSMAMRVREGDHLRADLDARRTFVADLVERVAVAADEGRAAMEQRLAERVRELRTELQADETAVAQEIVRTAARSDISEEVSRFRAHVSHWVDARRQRRAVRPEARLPAAGDEPRGEHDGLEGRRPARLGAHHRGEGGAREDARAGPECRVGRGLLFIVSAPSGPGKTTLVERLASEIPQLRLSRSYTSRPARPGEIDGVDYNFVSRERFEEMVAAGEFLEWADVFGNLYGTCAADTEALLDAGDDVVLVIDVQGARKVRQRGIETTAIFVMPPSFEVLEQRLRGRSKDSEAAIQRRLQVAREEVAAFAEYDFVVVNDEVTAAVDRLRSIVLAERARLAVDAA